MAGGRWWLVSGFAAMLAAALAGCSGSVPKTVPVQGKVVFAKGKPLANATIQFIPAAGDETHIANGTTGQDGAFQLQTYLDRQHGSLEGAVPGKYKVIVTPYPHGQRIAKRYGSVKDTPLSVDVPATGATNLTLEVLAGD